MSDKSVVVIDTQALLDWLVFRDASAAPWSAAVQARHLRWRSCPRMRTELAYMLGHPRLSRWNPQSEQALAVFDRHAELVDDPVATQPALRCRDPDDQVFIDLALAQRAGWLLTRDKALLALARHARPLGTSILRPDAWAAAAAAAP
jgi:putative PIN family toxin of toxin-antitoxin system